MARTVTVGLTLVFTVFPAAAAFGLYLAIPDREVLQHLDAGALGALLAGLFAPPALAFLAIAHLVQRRELGLLREVVAHSAESLSLQQQQLALAVRETRAQTDVLRQHLHMGQEHMRLAKRQIEAVMQHADQTRSQRLIAEWGLVVGELTALLAAMFRVAFGYRRPAGDLSHAAGLQEEVELPGPEELPLRVLRMLPAAPREAWTLEVDPRFAAHGERYLAVFESFLERVPARGGLIDRAFFEASVYGQIQARLRLLPRTAAPEAEPETEMGAAAD